MELSLFGLMCLMLAGGVAGAGIICFGGLWLYERWQARRIADRKEED